MTTKTFTFTVPERSTGVRGGDMRAAPLTAKETLFPDAEVKHSIVVGAERAGGARATVSAVAGEDVVVLHIANGPALVLHPESAYDLMRAQQDPTSQVRGEKRPEGEVEVPAQLRWRGLEAAAQDRGATRGFLGDVALEGLEVLTGVSKRTAAQATAELIMNIVDAQVDPGVYKLSQHELPNLKKTQQKLAAILPAPEGKPTLVLIHGTFSTTQGTFSKLWLKHQDLVKRLFDYYGNVYALDHKTLADSPIANALMLVEALPPNARIHLVTHSRGGLVAEVLARVCHDSAAGLENDALFAGTEYRDHRTALEKLARLVRERGIKVDRVVRVACPARGTLLASKRLDAYVSVLKWAFELGGAPVAAEIVDFLGAVAQHRAKPDMMPGLAAMVPDSALVKWLHATPEPIAGDLRVISGDLEADSLMSWLKTLLADAYYWTDNDLVVQTRSMYGGAPRAGGATFVFDHGGTVTHFNYFDNPTTAIAITDALVSAQPAGFRTIGPLSWKGEDSSGVRAARMRGGDSTRPALFLLPGILGSNLKVDGDRIWVSWRLVNNLKRIAYRPDQQNVEPDGPIELVYDALGAYLSETHDVIQFAYDWRKPIQEEAKRLAAAVRRELDARRQTGQPVRILAHSMGGVVARTMQLTSRREWDDMMAHEGARLLMLGVPNAGSWAPMQVLSGDDTFGNMLVATGSLFDDKGARELMAKMPGFIQLQAGLLDPALALDRAATWRKLADDDLEAVRQYNFWHSDAVQLNPYTWGVPPQDVIDQAVDLRKALDTQRDETLPGYADKIVLVVGRSSFTPSGFDTSEQGLFYLDAADGGDGRVTLGSAVLPGVSTWQLDCEHGTLPAQERAFAAFGELLETGTTNLLPALQTSAARGAPLPPRARVPSRPSRARMQDKPPERPAEVFLRGQLEAPSSSSVRVAALQVSIMNGDLSFERRPLMLGHYSAERFTGTERVMNRLIGDRMKQALEMRHYPDAPHSYKVFINACTDANPWGDPRPQAVIVVGLGPEGKLRSSDLAATVADGVIAWSQHLTEQRHGHDSRFEMAATLLGSGGIGCSVSQSAQAIVAGVQHANKRLAEHGWPTLGHLHLIDLYMDRASEAWRALTLASAGSAGLCQVTPTIARRAGALERPLDSGYRGARYDFISVVDSVDDAGEPAFSYTLDTRRARTEVRAQTTQLGLLRELLGGSSSDIHDDAQIGRTLFSLLVPIGLRPFFADTTDIQLELDRRTASVPWELLDADGGRANRDSCPWSIRAKLLRKLRTQEFRAQVTDATAEAGVLIIGEPACDTKLYDRLPYARAEAEAVSRCFGDIAVDARDAQPASHVKTLISANPRQAGPDARTIMNALFERPWRVIHVAGHGALDDDGEAIGVVLSNGTFLKASEIRNLEVVPELVFVNCCHLATFGQTPLQSRTPQQRAGFAAGVAEELMRIGVRCVVAAGWAVSDSGANEFATKFYGALLAGHRFIDAVALARKAAWALGGNTWAAYQCYGDPDWQFRKTTSDAQQPVSASADEFAGVASIPSLVLALRTLETRSKFQSDPADAQKAPLRYLETRFGAKWGGYGHVAEAFGAAWDATGNAEAAVEWYERAVKSDDGTATLRAVEQLANVRTRVEAEKARDAAQQGDASRLTEARKVIEQDIRELEKLIALHPTMERLSLLGSAHKRLAVIASLAKDAGAEKASIDAMYEHYGKAEALGRKTKNPDVFYPLFNRLMAQLCLGACPTPDAVKGDMAELEKLLNERVESDPDFWSAVGQTDLCLLDAITQRTLSSQQSRIEQGYSGIHDRVRAVRWWASIYDGAEFVLRKYAERTSEAAEKAAARKVTDLLRGFAR